MLDDLDLLSVLSNNLHVSGKRGFVLRKFLQFHCFSKDMNERSVSWVYSSEGFEQSSHNPSIEHLPIGTLKMSSL